MKYYKVKLDRRYPRDHVSIHICWFNFDVLTQGNVYKPTKEPINYRGPGGDWTHDLQTEETPPRLIELETRNRANHFDNWLFMGTKR